MSWSLDLPSKTEFQHAVNAGFDYPNFAFCGDMVKWSNSPETFAEQRAMR